MLSFPVGIMTDCVTLGLLIAPLEYGIMKAMSALFLRWWVLHCGGPAYAPTQERPTEGEHRYCRDAASTGTYGMGPSVSDWRT